MTEFIDLAEENQFLLGAFGLREADLEANRRGRLSATQKKRLWRRFCLLFPVGIVMVMGLLDLVFALDVMGKEAGKRGAAWLGNAVFLGLTAWLVWWLWQQFRDLRSGVVREVRGRVYKEQREVEEYDSDSSPLDELIGVGTTYTRTVYRLAVGSEQFKVSKKIYGIVGGGKLPHRVYYLPHSRRIMAVEVEIETSGKR